MLVEPSALAFPTVVDDVDWDVELEVELDEVTVVVVVVVFFFCGVLVESNPAQEEREREAHKAMAAKMTPLFILGVFIFCVRLKSQ